MLYPLSSKPAEYSTENEWGLAFKDSGNARVWYELFDENGTYAYLTVEFLNDVGAIHIHVTRWGPSVVRTIKEDWKELVQICRTKKAKKLMASYIGKDVKKWYKFIKLFSFPEPKQIMISTMEI